MMHTNKKYRVAIYALKPIIYQVPLWKKLASNPRVDLTVFYGGENHIDWGVPLLDGYKNKILPDMSRFRLLKFAKHFNPSIVNEIRRGGYDVVIVNGYDSVTSWLVLMTAKFHKIPLIIRGEAVLRPNRSRLRQYMKRIILSQMLSLYDAVLYSCTGNREYFEFYGVPTNKSFPLPCAVDNDYFRKERKKWISDKESTKRELGFLPEDFIVIFVGRLTKVKRPFDLLKVMKFLQDNDRNDINALIVGDGEFMDQMNKFIQSNDLHNVRIVGFQDHQSISKYLSIGDVSLVLSEYDPSPKALNEMMNFAMPVICTDVVGTVKDLVHESINGYVVKLGNIEMVAHHIQELAANRDQSRRMGQKSLEIISEWNFDRDVEGVLAAVDYLFLNLNNK